ncbi:carbohydrate-binding protein [Deefgea rivuli]|uniref:carbohydrate-binding protein n=1 Tax=Deefgea rivuli TaxID=400948 RepID=UPI0009FCA846|nr:carbohydrate-binding protein [Deefgea rivuli]
MIFKKMATSLALLALGGGSMSAAAAVSCADSWQATQVYTGGQSVVLKGNTYRAKWWTLGDSPLNNSAAGQVWELLSVCSLTTTPSITPQATPTVSPTVIPTTPMPSPSAKPTLTPSPTNSPTPSPITTPTAAPTNSPKPSVTPTATPTPINTPTPIPTLSPSPTPTTPSNSGCAAAWDAAIAYTAGAKVQRGGVNYQSKWWTQGEDPALNSGDAKPWQKLDICSSSATPTPSATPVASVTPKPSTTPSVTPTPSPVLTPVPTVTPAPSPSASPSALDHLMINEVAADPTGQGSWFEIYNPTSQAISLNDVSVRIQSKPLNALSTYALSGTIAAQSYVVVAANTEATASKKTAQTQYIGNYQDWPIWGADGSVELVRNNQTIDYVRFGSNATQPMSAAAWQGSPAAALSGTGSYALVRYYTQTSDNQGAADWRVVPFGTPGGRNDVDSDARDDDRDGIPTSAKKPGGTYAGLDLYAMGARAGRPTIMIQIDWMQSSNDEGIKPRKEALQMVRAAFNRKGIDLLMDVGQLYSPVLNAADFNMGSGKEVAYARCLSLYKSADCANAMDYKSDSMDVRRRLISHYMLMGSTQNSNGYGGSSGMGEINGNDFIVTLGLWGLTSSSGSELYKLINYQAGTIMHELGHNLGLFHGGDEGKNNKPNYLSVMNYEYQLNGVPSDPTDISERIYYRQNGLGHATPGKAANTYGVCELLDGPCSNRFVVDYSDGTSMPLNEWGLDEAKMIGRSVKTGAFADWNYNGIREGSVSRDVNDDGITDTNLNDYADWTHIQLAFNGSVYSVFRGATVAEPNSRQQVRLHHSEQEVSVETPPAFLNKK